MEEMKFNAGGFAPPPVDRFAEEYSDKKKSVAIILAFLLGVLGVHNFYLGHTKKAILQLLCAFIGISVIWVWIDIVMLLTGKIDMDGEGKLLI